MRNVAGHNAYQGDERRQPRDSFMIGVVLCAAAMVAIMALHGGPNLIGDRFDPDTVLQSQQ